MEAYAKHYSAACMSVVAALSCRTEATARGLPAIAAHSFSVILSSLLSTQSRLNRSDRGLLESSATCAYESGAEVLHPNQLLSDCLSRTIATTIRSPLNGFLRRHGLCRRGSKEPSRRPHESDHLYCWFRGRGTCHPRVFRPSIMRV